MGEREVTVRYLPSTAREGKGIYGEGGEGNKETRRQSDMNEDLGCTASGTEGR